MQSATRDITALTRRALISKSRFFYGNSPTFSGIIDRLVSYVVGAGLHVAPNTSSSEFNTAAARVWREWCELPEFSSDDNFLALQSQLVRSIFVDGDVFVLKTFDESGMPKIQLVESHRITDLGFYGIDMPDGVKIDTYGRPLSYSYATTEDATKFINIPARAVVRMNLSKRVNQYRGVPLASSALNTVHDISDVVLLEKQAVKFGSSFIGSITRDSGEIEDPMDGKPAIFNAQSIKHVVGDHNINEGRKRMSEIYFAQDTIATGISFKSLNKGKKQTEFIKEYDTGNGKKYFYTARRGDNNLVYTWHEITRGNYNKKKKVCMR